MHVVKFWVSISNGWMIVIIENLDVGENIGFGFYQRFDVDKYGMKCNQSINAAYLKNLDITNWAWFEIRNF